MYLRRNRIPSSAGRLRFPIDRSQFARCFKKEHLPDCATFAVGCIHLPRSSYVSPSERENGLSTRTPPIEDRCCMSSLRTFEHFACRAAATIRASHKDNEWRIERSMACSTRSGVVETTSKSVKVNVSLLDSNGASLSFLVDALKNSFNTCVET